MSEIYPLIVLLIGIISTANDDKFVRLILGDSYVNMTMENIAKGDPMAVYKKMNQVDMFMGITFNNIVVSFYTFIAGILLTFGTGYMLFSNGAPSLIINDERNKCGLNKQPFWLGQDGPILHWV